jgi:hypothetical protein
MVEGDTRMKCPKCGGTGKEYWNGNVFCNTGFECDKCNGTGEVEQTNEKWLDRKSTKEKAEWLFKLTYKCYWCGREYTQRSLSLFNEKECPFKKCMKDKKDFEKWLKQPHKEE